MSEKDLTAQESAGAVVSPKVCDVCKGRKIVHIYSEYDGKLNGSQKCWECNRGTRTHTSTDHVFEY